MPPDEYLHRLIPQSDKRNCSFASAVRRSVIFCRELDSERRRRQARRYWIWKFWKRWKLITYLYVFPFQLFQVSQVSAHVMPITPCFAKARRRDRHRLASPRLVQQSHSRPLLWAGSSVLLTALIVCCPSSGARGIISLTDY